MSEGKVRPNANDLSAVIPYCSLESDLIWGVVGSLQICSEVVLVTMTHLFDGTPDPLAWEHATQIAEKYPNVIPVLLQWREGNVPLRYWIQEMRQAGYARTTKNWLLFIDSDEELRLPAKFLQWFLFR